MSLTVEEQKLVVSVTGATEVERLTKLYEQEESTLRDLIHLQQSGATLTAGQRAQYERTAASMVANTKAIQATQAATRGFQQNIQGLGYALNDFFSVSGGMQQRLASISNNMPMLLAGFGGWGLVLSALLPIIGALLPQLEHFAASLGLWDAEEGMNRLERLKAKIKELEDTKVKLAVDVTELDTARKDLDNLQKALAAFRTFEEARSKRQRESAAAVQVVIEQSNGPATGEALKEKAAKDLEKTDSDLINARKRVAEQEALAADIVADPMAEPGLAQVHLDLAEQAREGARKRVADIRAKDGPAEQRVGEAREKAGRGDVGDLVDQLRGIGRLDLSRKVEAASPEALKAQEKAFREVQKVVGSDLPILFRRFSDDLKMRQNDRAMADDTRRAAATESPESEGIARAKRQQLFDEARARNAVERLPGGRQRRIKPPPRDPKIWGKQPAGEGPEAMAPAGPTGLMGALASTLVGALATAVSKVPGFAGAHNAGKTTGEIIRGQKDADAERNRQAQAALKGTAEAHDRDAEARQRFALDSADGSKPIGPHGAGGVRGGRQGNAAEERARAGQKQMRAKQAAREARIRAAATKKLGQQIARRNRFNVRPATAGGGRMMGPKPGEGLLAAAPGAASDQVMRGVIGVNEASLRRDRSAQVAAGEMMATMQHLAQGHAQGGQGWDQLAAQARQLRSAVQQANRR